MRERGRIAGVGMAAVMIAASTAMCCTAAAATDEQSLADVISDNSLPTGDIIGSITMADSMQLLGAAEVEALDERMNAYQAPEVSLIKNNAVSFYYYDQLEGDAKQIYDVLLGVASDPTDANNIGLLMTMTNPETEEFFDSYVNAYYAMLYDHPELFWLYNSTENTIQYCSDRNNMNGIYFVYFVLDSAYANYEEEMNLFNQAADDFLTGIDQTVSDYEIVRQVHDLLIQLVTYDTAVLEQDNGGYYNLAHTAYGALVTDSEHNANYAVCDGYSLAFEYLLQQCGVEVVFNAGMAGSSEWDAGGHAWNLVKLDGSWYEVDTTWDDMGAWMDDMPLDTDGYDYFYAAYHDENYFQKIQHYLFLLSTDSFRNYSPDDSLYYYFDDGVYLSMVGESVHIRFSSGGLYASDYPQAEVLALTPTAEYSYR